MCHFRTKHEQHYAEKSACKVKVHLKSLFEGLMIYYYQL